MNGLGIVIASGTGKFFGTKGFSQSIRVLSPIKNRIMKRHQKYLLGLTSIITLTLVGCVAPAPTQHSTSIKCLVPVVTALDETKESQEKGGLQISVVPVLYKAARADKVTMVHAEAGITE